MIYNSNTKNVVYGMRTVFEVCKSTSFTLIYNSKDFLKKYEQKYKLRRLSLFPEKTEYINKIKNSRIRGRSSEELPRKSWLYKKKLIC
jgi:ribosomal protein S24E